MAGAIDGVYVQFESFPGLELALESLDIRRGRTRPELLAVHQPAPGGEQAQTATVFIPDGRLGSFLRSIEKYVETSETERPARRKLVDSIADIRLATLSALWTDAPGEFPDSAESIWWEIWLRHRDGEESRRFSTFAKAAQITVGSWRLGFADRTVLLARATSDQLAAALDVLDDLAELRRPREPATLIAREPAADQADWISQLVKRTTPSDESLVSACILDTGVHRLHRLLAHSLEASDCHAVEASWGNGDHDGHGTEMAGLALYGDVAAALLAPGPLTLRHRLESVKILPPPPKKNPPELFGAVTAAAVSRVEIEAPQRRRVFSLAVTCERDSSSEGHAGPTLGSPTSWSAAVDALAAGIAIDSTGDHLVFLDEEEEPNPRLFVVSAGNIRGQLDEDYLARCDVEPVEEPAQAWNALTVGACTELDDLSSDPSMAGWSALAPRGEISPSSRTSVAFSRQWPSKPDVVLEGGNAARSPTGNEIFTHDALQVLTTRAPSADARLLTTTDATSAATAGAAHLAASVMAEYPSLWPETIRALIVQSAEWTPAMLHWMDAAHSRETRVSLQRRYGMGVPDVARALRSASDSLTLIVQGIIHPFDNDGRMREMHVHNLPWPGQILADLGEVEVRLRVTLSYFIVPNPARRGWKKRFAYRSHGLRFDIRRAAESNDEFRKRLNAKALAEDEQRPSSAASDAQQWFFGPDARVAGSLHTDIWRGTAADLAARGVIAVYPVAGWWKERKDRDRSDRGVRYALVVSIETPDQPVDIWTPVAQQIGVPIEIET